MKTKQFILLLFSSLTYTAFAQVEKGKGIQYKWSVSVAINSVEAQMDQKLFDTWVFPSANYYAYYGDKHDRSLSLSITPKYQIANDIFLRLEFGITNIDLRSHYNGIGDTLTQNQGHIGATVDMTKDEIIQQKIYRYAVGIQWNFMKIKFIEPYCSVSLYYLHYSEMHWSDKIAIYPITGRSTSYIATTPGGFATGIGAFAGVNIYLNKRISLGGEFSASLLYYKFGGVQDGTMENTYPTTPTETLNWKIYNNTSKGIQFSKVMPSLNITIRF